MFPLPPAEAVVIADIYRHFPDTREVELRGEALREANIVAAVMEARNLSLIVIEQGELWDAA